MSNLPRKRRSSLRRTITGNICFSALLFSWMPVSGADAGVPIFHSITMPGGALMDTYQESPGYGISDYFSLEDATPANIIDQPVRRPQQAIRILVTGGRIHVQSNQAKAGRIQVRFINAQGRILQSGTEILPPGGAVLKIPSSARGVLALDVDGGELGRSIRLLPPTLHNP